MTPKSQKALSSSDLKVRPELLAPAGHLEAFHAAVEAGADAVYLGLRRLSARAHAANFSLDDLSRLLPFARNRNVLVYVALNSVVSAPEVPSLLDTLSVLSDLGVDALIVQDPGVFLLCRRYFPQLRLHASTLMAVHNSAGIRSLKKLGARRVVLARELTLGELRKISKNSDLELEIFVHGALCFSISGLCLASSFRGGHSGLQGRCVQPCRLKFRQGRKEGYFFSCGDFSALPWLPELMKLRLAAFKIEGRMKDAEYIATVVRAYRSVLDAPRRDLPRAVEEAKDRLKWAPARRLTDGFLGPKPQASILTPHRSGSSGLWVGTVKKVLESELLVEVRHRFRTGDRLRPESDRGREEKPFVVEGLRLPEGETVEEAIPGKDVVLLTGRKGIPGGKRLFRIGRKPVGTAVIWRKIRKEASEPLPFEPRFEGSSLWEKDLLENATVKNVRRLGETLVVKVGHYGDLSRAFQSPAQWVFCTATKENLERVAKTRFHEAQRKRFVWSLPPVVFEKDLRYYQEAVAWFWARGIGSWEINNWGHLEWFAGKEKVKLIAGARMNVRNKAAMAALAESGCRWVVLSVEITREELKELIRDPVPAVPIVSIYGQPFLFVSRIHPPVLEKEPFRTLRGDRYVYAKKGEVACVWADHPFCWFEKLPELRAMGYRCFLVDLSEGAAPVKEADWTRILSGYKRHRADAPYSLFNYDKKPVPGSS